MTRRLSPGLLGLLFLVASASSALAQSNGIRFFKNNFYTGSHVAAGVALKGTGVDGFATGDIWIGNNPNTPEVETGVPEGADIVAAYVYWMTVTSRSGNGAAGATFNDGVLLPDGSVINGDISVIAKNLNPNGTAPCWSAGGATGDGGDARVVKTYRADVLPLLPPGPDGRRRANGKHTIKVPDMGTGNAVPSVAGATLIVLYRLAGAPLTATVIYDGGFTLNQANPRLSLPMQGWYQSLTAQAGAPALLTQWVANGQSNFSEVMTVTDANQSVLFQTANPFVGTGGPWDTYTASFTLPSGSASATLTVERGATTGSFDCLSWGGFAMTVPVQDRDFDGLLDIMESPGTSGTIRDPKGILLPDLYAMGARPDIKDVFIEFGFMKSSAGYSNALNQTIAAGHSHIPARDALDRMARAFRSATPRINVHYDIGNNYQDNVLPPGGWNNCPTASDTDWTPSCAIVRAANADGGELIEELPCDTSTKSCTFAEYPAPLPCATAGGCQFDGVPGTVGWKSGFRAYRDEPLNFRKTQPYTVNNKTFQKDIGPDEVACSIAENDVNADGTPNLATSCKRRFARTRSGLFHYVLWAHAIGIPKSDDESSPLFHLPKNISGMADYRGGDLMMTLGLWDNGTGSPFMQASTLMHELGHNLGRRHGGETGELNCKPNYQSVMNYLFQVGGLVNAAGVPQINYSAQLLSSLDETALNESTGLGNMNWRTRWYTPWSDSFVAKNLTISPVTRRCNGSPVVGEVMARVDGATTTAPIDWNANGVIDPLAAPQDVNFSGSEAFDHTLSGSNDWASLDLQQVGSRRNVGGWSIDSGYWDAGYWDAGYWDAGYWDAGYWDAGYWDAGVENNAPLGEVDLDVAEGAGIGPNSVSAVISGKNVLVTWAPPVVSSDKIDHYEVYRIEGTAVTPAALTAKAPINVLVPASTTQALDTTAKNNVQYIYVVLAQFTDGRRSGISISPVFVK